MFTGFTAKHFDAYRESKWRSRAFNLERMAVKDELAALGRSMGPTLCAAHGTPLAVELSAEYPALWNHRQVDAQHLYFSRPMEQRKDIDRITDRARGMASLIEDPSPQRSHVFLTVSITCDHVFAGLKLHHDASVDRQNLERQLGEPGQAQELMSLLAALPTDIHLGIDRSSAPAATCTMEAVHALVHDLAAPLGPGQSRWLMLGRRIERRAAIELGRNLAQTLLDVLVAALPVYRYVAWSPDNDHVAMANQLRGQDIATSQRGLARNDTVRVMSGMFAGRTGVVQEIDGKGTIRVLIGSIPIKLRAADVEKQ